MLALNPVITTSGSHIVYLVLIILIPNWYFFKYYSYALYRKYCTVRFCNALAFAGIPFFPGFRPKFRARTGKVCQNAKFKGAQK